MNCVLSTIVVVVVVLLGLIIQDLDARKLESSFSNGGKKLEKSRHKRQDNQFQNSYPDGACDFDSPNPCRNYLSDLRRNAFSLRRAIKILGQRYNFFLNGRVSVADLQNGGMCAPNTNLFTSNAFSALDLGHITLPQLATLRLFPVQSVDTDTLRNAGYMNTYGQTNLLSALGVQASIFGHIVPSELQSLGLYPLQTNAITLNDLLQANYITKDCIPTALGLSALHIRYLSINNLAELGCQSGDYSQINSQQLADAGYTYGASNILTPVALAALYTGFFSRDQYQRLNAFPFAANNQPQSAENVDQDQPPANNILNDLVHVGYLHANNYLLTGIAYQAIKAEYFSVDNFRNLNVWPCPGKPSMNLFVSAGYATYSGHLTGLGYSLLKAQYYPSEWLSKLGIHLHAEYHIFHHALRYAGFSRSPYREAHDAIHAADDASSEADQDSQDQTTTSSLPPSMPNFVIERK